MITDDKKIIPLGVLEIAGEPAIVSKVITKRTCKISVFKNHQKKDLVGEGQSKKIVWNFKEIKTDFKLKQKNGRVEDIKKCSDFSFSYFNGFPVLFYSKNPDKKVCIATSKDSKTWKVIDEIKGADGKAFLVPYYNYKGNPIAFLKKSAIHVATSKNLTNWKISNFINGKDYGGHIGEHASLLGSEMAEQGIIVFFDKIVSSKDDSEIQIWAILCSYLQPNKIIWASSAPIWSDKISKGKKFRPLGIVNLKDCLGVFWADENEKVYSVPLPKVIIHPDKISSAVKLSRYHKNPVIVPNPENHWESSATFNPGAVLIDNKVHVLYRAQGYDGISYLGYASSENGFDFNERGINPAYTPRRVFEGVNVSSDKKNARFMSGGGWGGCEDPRLVLIDEKVYLTYSAYDGWSAPRMAISSISISDFKDKNWDEWEKPSLISPPGQVNKNWVIFPDKINGKYAIIHSISPKILIEYLDDLDFKDGKYIKSSFSTSGRRAYWDSWVRGAGPPPIKTSEGWLLMYHAMDRLDPNKYKVGAMILDSKNPENILFRSEKPLLEPDMHYENEGFKRGVVYACGTTIINGRLFVYYGGADSVTCVATADLDELLFNIKKDRGVEMVLNPVKISIKN